MPPTSSGASWPAARHMLPGYGSARPQRQERRLWLRLREGSGSPPGGAVRHLSRPTGCILAAGRFPSSNLLRGVRNAGS